MVSGLSYGTSRTMVNRGPQLVQLMNGYRNLRSAGSDSSRRQSAHVAVSAATRVLRRPWPAGDDTERRHAQRSHVGRGDPLDPGERGRIRLQNPEKLPHHPRRTFDLGEHPVDVVADQAAEPEAGRQRVHERAEADPLDDPLHPDSHPDGGPDEGPSALRRAQVDLELVTSSRSFGAPKGE